jgi:hypothetical protein
VSFFLRLTGITNAAAWFGTALFFTLAVGPAFSSVEMLQILPPSHSGAAAQIVLERYFAVHYCCGGIALCHFVLEWLYAGKPLHRWPLYWVIGLLAVGLWSGLSVEPKLRRLHLELYGVRSTPHQREQAGAGIRTWQGLLQTSNWVMLLGLWIYMWEASGVGGAPRFGSAGKFRG